MGEEEHLNPCLGYYGAVRLAANDNIVDTKYAVRLYDLLHP